MLKIIKPSDPIVVERLNLCIYSLPGIGKTTLGYMADTALNLDCDLGVQRSRNRIADTVRIHTWDDLAGMTVADLKGYKTLVPDTAGRLLDKLSLHLMEKDPKCGTGGSLTQKGWGQLKNRFADWLKLVNSTGLDVVMLCHMDEKQQGDEFIERLDVQGSSKAEIYKSADAMGRLYLKGGKRYLDFSPRDNSFGKNPVDLPVLEVPDFHENKHFLADLIRDIKAKMNEQTAEQKAAQTAVAEMCAVVDRMPANIVALNQTIVDFAAKKVPVAVRRHLIKHGEQFGFVFNKEAKKFEVRPGAPVTQEELEADTEEEEVSVE